MQKTGDRIISECLSFFFLVNVFLEENYDKVVEQVEFLFLFLHEFKEETKWYINFQSEGRIMYSVF